MPGKGEGIAKAPAATEGVGFLLQFTGRERVPEYPVDFLPTMADNHAQGLSWGFGCSLPKRVFVHGTMRPLAP
jgi:hypothetical protein